MSDDYGGMAEAPGKFLRDERISARVPESVVADLNYIVEVTGMNKSRALQHLITSAASHMRASAQTKLEIAAFIQKENVKAALAALDKADAEEGIDSSLDD